jgi:hypothetical protein
VAPPPPPPPSLSTIEKNGLVPLTQDQHLSPGPLEDPTNRHNDGGTPCTSEDLGADTLPQLLEGGGQECAENVSRLEREMLLAFKEQEDLSVTAPSSPLPRRHSPEATREHTGQEQDPSGSSCGGLKEPKDSSLDATQAEEGEPHGQQQKEEAVGAIKGFEGCGSMPDQAESAETCAYQDVRDAGGDNHPSECNSSSRNTNDEVDEDDEEPRSAKRRKQDSRVTRQTPVEVRHHISQTFRSPSATKESVPVAAYQEWPFQGFLKRTRIGNETTYNLEFKLPCISERLNLPIEVCDDGSNEDVLASPLTRPKAPSSHSKISTLASRFRTKVGWTPEDDTRLVNMRNSGRSWKEIYAAFPHRTPGTIHVRCSTKLKSRLV